MNLSKPVRYLARYVALGYLFLLLIVPVGLILWRTFTPGVGAFFESITTPAAVSALQLSLLVVAIVVPLNVLFGVPTALVLARNRFRGKSVLQAIIDLPFAVSPVVVGVALILLWGTAGIFGFVENDFGLKIIFGFPGIVLASIFVTVPFVIREVEPVLHELGALGHATPSRRGSISHATRRARPSALKAASARWWSFRPVPVTWTVAPAVRANASMACSTSCSGRPPARSPRNGRSMTA